MSQRSRDKIAREAADASTSGAIPIMGLLVLAFIVAAFVRLIF